MSRFTSVSKLTKNMKCNHYSTTLSYMHKTGDPLQYITIGTLVEEAARKFSARKAIISKDQNRFLTFSEVLTEADKLAAGFKAVGLEKQDRVGLWAPNIVEWYLTQIACARAGLITVCINPVYQPPEVEFCVNKAGIKALVCGNKFKDLDYYEQLLTLTPELKDSRPGKLKSARVPSLNTVITIGDREKHGTYNYNEVSDLGSRSDISGIEKLQHGISPDDPTILHLTSGTTGTPKIALLSHFSLVNNGFLFGKASGLSPGQHVICSQVPFFHIFGTIGSILPGLHYGATIVLPTDGYNADKTFDAIIQEKCTIISGTPTMFLDLIETQQRRKEQISLENVIVGGAFASPELLKDIYKKLRAKKVTSVYGMTEMGGAIFASPLEDEEEKNLTTVGTLLENAEAKVIDGNDRVVPFGTAGELCVRRFYNMLGYWNDEEETGKTLGQDGWLKTGDQFILEKDGYGKIVGRIKDLVNRGGENIFPQEIEEFLLTHPDILDVQVIGTPHARLGEEVCACIRKKPDSSITLQDVATFCKGKLAYFKIPSKIQFFDEFPKTASGKIQKNKLRDIVTSK